MFKLILTHVLEHRLRYLRVFLFTGFIMSVALLTHSGMLPSQVTSINAQITTNDNFPLSAFDPWVSGDSKASFHVAWGDVDNDGDLDLVVSNSAYTPNCPDCPEGDVLQLYLNENGVLQSNASWTSADNDRTIEVAWGDVDGDGDLDLAAATRFAPTKVYINDNGVLETSASWQAAQSDDTWSIAWGDVDGDGDLDLATGGFGSTNKLYENQGGSLQTSPVWNSADVEVTSSVAWGDMDNDGDLDLVVGNHDSSNKIYFNNNGSLQTAAGWSSGDTDRTNKIALGDVDNDGDLDLAVANTQIFDNGCQCYVGGENKLYLNELGGLQTAADDLWLSGDTDPSNSVAWGDVDGDGDLDLAVGNEFDPNKVYLNRNGVLQTAADSLWDTGDFDGTFAVAWGDVDGDGDLDLAAANAFYDWNCSCYVGEDNKIYYNHFGVVETGLDEVLLSDDYFGTFGVALGDVDGDGDLDLATADTIFDFDCICWLAAPNHLYLNVNNRLHLTAAWASEESDRAFDVAWGDVDNDGDLDLATAVDGINKLYRNVDGMLETTAFWVSEESSDSRSVAWGDVDNDGDLDLLFANYEDTLHLYYNQEGVLDTRAGWSSAESLFSFGAAWGDVDNDGDLDLAVADRFTSNKLYLNDNGQLQQEPQWVSGDNDSSWDVVWGDIDGDGDLDLAVANQFGPNKLYLNEQGSLQTAADNIWNSGDSDNTFRINWGDVDGDGDLDLVTVNDQSADKIYLNQGGRLQTADDNIWIDQEPDDVQTSGLDLGDVNNDGTIDLVLGKPGARNRVYLGGRSRGSNLPFNLPAVTVERPIDDPITNYHVPSELVTSPIIPIEYTLFAADDDFIGHIRAEYSFNGGGQWFPAVATAETPLVNLSASPTGVKHTYQWDTLASGFFGQSNNVVFRITVYQHPSMGQEPNTVQYTNHTPFPIQRPYTAATTFPFRVRGTQIQVTEGVNLDPVTEAFVYRLNPDDGSRALPIINVQNNQPYRTMADGYLPGYGRLELGDQLVALKPVASPPEIAFTDKIDFYHTSAAATATSLDLFTVETSGVQQLVVSDDNQLMLLNLSASLEWDAAKDTDYLEQLEIDFKRASEILYDLTNGQVALGEITVYQNKEYWNEADIVIYASNTQRPSANLGGIVDDVMSDQNSAGDEIPFAFLPGQIRMPPVWNRYGNPEGTIGEDWPRVLAHEIGHYALFMIDNYLGLDERNNLILIDCQGSAMTDAYRQDYSEFLTAANWTDDCLDSVAEKATGRSDWETILLYYGSFLSNDQTVQTEAGPQTLPLAVTQVIFSGTQKIDPLLLDPPFFYLSDGSGETLAVANGQATGYLLKNQDTVTLEDDFLIPLGAPVGSLLRARGARKGDTICVYDYSADVPRTVCLEEIDSSDATLKLEEVSTDWAPEILINPLDDKQLQVQVSQTGVGDLEIQIYPTYRPTDTVKALTETVLAVNDGEYVVTFQFPMTLFHGHVRVREVGSNPRKETIIPFSITPKWDGNSFSGWGGNQITGWDGNSFSGWGGNSFSGWGGNSFSAWGGNSFSAWGAPVVSADGQVTLFDTENIIGGGNSAAPAAVMQAIQTPPHLPSWLTPVGQAYRYDTDGGVDSGLVILFRYLERELPFVNESSLAIYYLADGMTAWHRLDTTVDASRNQASAAVLGVGTYALVATEELGSFALGWNLFGYPLDESRPVAEALESIAGKYTSVMYQANSSATNLPRLFDPYVAENYPEFAPLVNDLEQFQSNGAYWIFATQQPLTAYLAVENPDVSMRQSAMIGEDLPATYFGYVLDDGYSAGMTVVARVNGVNCGQTTLVEVGESLGYVVRVRADDGGDGCGDSGRVVQFSINGTVLNSLADWENSRAYLVNLSTAAEPLSNLLLQGDTVVIQGETADFSASATGADITYSWSFGDGETDMGAAVEHLFVEAGTYQVTVTATNSVSMRTQSLTVRVVQDFVQIYLPLVQR